MDKNDNREGSTRQLKNGSWECITQAKYLNPKTANPKRFKRTAKTEKEARRLSIMARDSLFNKVFKPLQYGDAIKRVN